MELLYHYCSTTTFHAIASSRTLRLSSLTSSNDEREGKLVAEIVGRICEREGIPAEMVAEVVRAISAIQDNFDGLGLCLSEKGDLLGQWRGYAGDATGFSIGFDYGLLASLCLQAAGRPRCFLHKVAYDIPSQEAELRPIVDALLPQLRTRADGAAGGQSPVHAAAAQPWTGHSVLPLGPEVHRVLLESVWSLYSLKPEGFKEEEEWRLFSYLPRSEKFGCSYQARNDRIVPYFDIPFEPLFSPIREVIVGPRNRTPVPVVEDFLGRSRSFDVAVRRSSLSYR
jgi:hypothetical protein